MQAVSCVRTVQCVCGAGDANISITTHKRQHDRGTEIEQAQRNIGMVQTELMPLLAPGL